MSEATPVLVVTSTSSPAAAVVPLLAALDVAGASVRALDVGRLGARADNVATRVVRAIAGEVSGRRLARVLDERSVAVAVAFDPASTRALAELRGARPFAIAAVVAELDPADDWADAVADRYLVVDERAATLLQEHGVDGDRIVATGPLAAARFVAAALEEPAALRTRFKIDPDAPVVVVEVAGLGADAAGQLALELSLGQTRATYLFAAGADAEVAAVLRARVPTLGMRAKLFGATADAPLYHRAADVVIGPARLGGAFAALAVGARMVAVGDHGDAARAIGDALEARGVGRHAEGPSAIGAALEPLLARTPRTTSVDGAAVCADAVLVMGKDAALIAGEREAEDDVARMGRPPRASSSASAAGGAAGDLEDLGGGNPGPGARERPPARAKASAASRAELVARLAEANARIAAARASAEAEEVEVRAARGRGDAAGATTAERAADVARRAMHEALGEVAELTAAIDEANRSRARESRPPGTAEPRPAGGRAGAPPGRSVDDLLSDLKRQGGAARPAPGRPSPSPSPSRSSAVDDELEALKRKMSRKKETP